MPLCIEKRQFFTYFLSLCFGSVVAYGLVVIVKDFFKVVVSRMDDKRTISSNLLKQLLGNVGNYIPKPVDMQHMPLYFVALWVYRWNVLCELFERAYGRAYYAKGTTAMDMGYGFYATRLVGIGRCVKRNSSCGF